MKCENGKVRLGHGSTFNNCNKNGRKRKPYSYDNYTIYLCSKHWLFYRKKVRGY